LTREIVGGALWRSPWSPGLLTRQELWRGRLTARIVLLDFTLSGSMPALVAGVQTRALIA